MFSCLVAEHLPLERMGVLYLEIGVHYLKDTGSVGPESYWSGLSDEA